MLIPLLLLCSVSVFAQGVSTSTPSVPEPPAVRPAAPPPAAAAQLTKGDAAYYAGDATKALAAYEKASKISTTTAEPWLDGAVVLEELGERKKAEQWLKAASLRTSDADAWSALGWSQWRAGELRAARDTFDRALTRAPKDAYALLGAARVALDLDQPRESLKLLERAADAAPLLGLVPYYEGKAYEKLGDSAHAAQAYREAVISDSYFLEGRDALGRLAVKRNNYGEAYRQFSRMLDVEPHNKRILGVVTKVQAMLARRGGDTGLVAPSKAPPAVIAPSPPVLNAPVVRVGIGTNGMGKPRARLSQAFKVNGPFALADSGTGKTLAKGGGDESWQVRLKRVKKKRVMLVLDASGRIVAQSKTPVLVVPADQAASAITLQDTGKLVRGRLEIAIFKSNLRLVDIVDLENYTQGVTAAEMPVKSPIEALKAQAIIARTDAIAIKNNRRHKHEGYDVCDGEHCQVYAGLRAESARSRDVVDATRGQIVTYHGKIAHVIFSSNCGGHTQSSADLNGWGEVPYWQGMRDSVEPDDAPLSPWQLRLRMKSWPQSFCQPSNDVHPSHYRWSRVVAARELEDRVARRLRLGKLKWVRALKRSRSGNVNTVLFQGTKRNVKVTDEMQIRGLLALGSLRSTQFVIEPEYGPQGKVESFVFHGGGWGHGVGLCQSGAMGRAQAGETVDQIIKAYFKGTELGKLPY